MFRKVRNNFEKVCESEREAVGFANCFAFRYDASMQDPAKLIERFKSRVHVLDGGLATELEKRGHDISGKLWSARVLLEDSGAIEQLHYDYLRSGADIIITSSYQLTFQGMQEAGYTHQQAEDALWKSVEVAVKARDRYLAELDEDPPEDRKPLIAASIGPYGAYLADGSEYTGVYRGTTANEVYQLHKARLDVLCRTEADLMLCETFPNELEMHQVAAELGRVGGVPCWMSASCDDSGKMRDGSSLAVAVVNVANELRANLVAFGANCCSPKLPSKTFNEIRTVSESMLSDLVSLPIILGFYPNSGEGWDAEHRCWVGENDADHFAEHAREWIKAGANIIGGCCRTGPEHIAQLRAVADAANRVRDWNRTVEYFGSDVAGFEQMQALVRQIAASAYAEHLHHLTSMVILILSQDPGVKAWPPVRGRSLTIRFDATKAEFVWGAMDVSGSTELDRTGIEGAFGKFVHLITRRFNWFDAPDDPRKDR